MLTSFPWFRGRRALLLGLLACAGSSLPVPALAQTALINALDDLAGTWNGTSQIQLTSNHCVASSTRNFQVRITGSGTGGAFQLRNGTKTLPYTVDYRDTNGTFDAVTAGNTLTGQVTTDNTTASCSVATQLRVRVTISAAALATATAGNYTGTITVLITPV